MKTYATREQLKTEVKKLLQGNWKKAIMLYLIPLIVYLVSDRAGQSDHYNRLWDNFNYYDLSGIFMVLGLTGLVGFIFSLVFILINQSANFRGLDWLRDPELDFQPFSSNFTYFKNPDWWKIILVYIISSIFTFLWTLLLVIPGIIKSFAYSQTYFIYKDINDKNPDNNLSLTDYITKSRQLMDGNKGRYFVLLLSFIGWWLLGLITFGIGFIWIFPYFKLTLANFYRDLIAQNPEILE